MRDYIVSFFLDGRLAVHSTNKDLFLMERSNFKLIMLEYAGIVLATAFLLKKAYQVAEVAINRKIVI
jgi:hypothetical protein